MGVLNFSALESFSLSKVVAVSALSCVIYLVGVGFHRLYLSPYSKFPGPKLAGLTYGYMFYYDGIKGGQYMYKIQQLHEEYGM